MTSLTFSDPAVQDYLAAQDIAILATVAPDGSPLAMPMWFIHDSASMAMVSVAKLRKITNLQANPRVSVVVESGARGGANGVVLSGEVRFYDEPERTQWAERFRDKYSPQIGRLWTDGRLPANRTVFGFVARVVSAWGI